MSVNGGFLSMCSETEIITIPLTARAHSERWEIAAPILTQRSDDRQQKDSSVDLRSGWVGILLLLFIYFFTAMRFKIKAIKEDQSKPANIVLMIYMFVVPVKAIRSERAGLQTVSFAYTSPGESPLTCYLPLCFGRTTPQCVSLSRWGEGKKNNSMIKNASIHASLPSSTHALQQNMHTKSRCIPSLRKK